MTMEAGFRAGYPSPGERGQLDLAKLPLNRPAPWAISFLGQENPGEVVRADRWQTQWGQPLPKSCHFRLVVLTSPQEVPQSELQDRRIVVMAPSAPTLSGPRPRPRQIREATAAYGAARLYSLEPLDIHLAEVLAGGEAAVLGLLALTILVRSQWQPLLPYLVSLAPEAAPLGPAQASPRLLARLDRLTEEVRGVRDSLERASGLGVPPESLGLVERLGSLARSRSLGELAAVLSRTYSSAQALQVDLSDWEKLAQVAAFATEAAGMHEYLREASPALGDDLAMDRASLLEQLTFRNFMATPHLWPSLKSLFDLFRPRYSAQYLAHHSRYHQEMARLESQLRDADSRLGALGRLNSLEDLGPPLGQNLPAQFQEVVERIHPCPEASPSLQAHPICAVCGVALGAEPPAAEVGRLLDELDRALKEQLRRLSSQTIHHILAPSQDNRIEQFLQVLQASDVASLVQILDDDVTEFLRQLLVQARTIPFPILSQLREGFSALEEGQVEEAVAYFRARLLAAFEESKKRFPARPRISLE
ncbi:MAG: hypothetical protein HY676_01895 [Chloroflexi bacterium]|nr:hypothetical protein [Chloroflexota bacterium]